MSPSDIVTILNVENAAFAVMLAVIVSLLKSNAAKDKVIIELSSKALELANVSNRAISIAAERRDDASG